VTVGPISQTTSRRDALGTVNLSVNCVL